MFLDAWGIKLKEGVPIELANWDTIEDIDETDIIPKSNYFHIHAFSPIHQSFIRYILKEKNIPFDFMGYPCCSLEVMRITTETLNGYLEENICEVYVWNESSNKKNILPKKEVFDLYDYLRILTDNGFIMWFS